MGFRVFEVGLRSRRGKTDQAWTNDSTDMALVIYDCIRSIEQKQFSAEYLFQDLSSLKEVPGVGIWRLGADGKPKPHSHAVQIEECTRINRQISVRFRYGAYGRFSGAIGPSGYLSLDGYAPVRHYRAELFVPKAPDPKGVLVVEALGRSCPDSVVSKALAIGSRIRNGPVGSSAWPLDGGWLERGSRKALQRLRRSGRKHHEEVHQRVVL